MDLAMLILAIVVGAIAMVVLSPIPILGPVIAGFIAGVIAGGGVIRGLLAGFFSGTIIAIFAGVIFTAVGAMLGAIVDGWETIVLGGITGAVLGAGMFVCALYFGLLGVLGGIPGALLRPRRRY